MRDPDRLERHGAYRWQGLTLSHTTLLGGVELSPEMALVRAREAIDRHNGHTTGDPASGRMTFDELVSAIRVTGSMYPARFDATIRAVRLPIGLSVTALTELTPQLVGAAASLAAVTALCIWWQVLFSELHIGLTFVMLVLGGWHLWRISRILRAVTTAATTL